MRIISNRISFCCIDGGSIASRIKDSKNQLFEKTVNTGHSQSSITLTSSGALLMAAMAVPMSTNRVNSESNGVLEEATATQPRRMGSSSRESFASPLPRPKPPVLMAESPTVGHVKKLIGVYAQRRSSGGGEAKPFFTLRKKLDTKRIPQQAREKEAPPVAIRRRSSRELCNFTSPDLIGGNQNESPNEDGGVEKSDNHEDLDNITDSVLEISDDIGIKRLGDSLPKEAVENLVEREEKAPCYPNVLEQDYCIVEATSISDERVGNENTPDQIVSSDNDRVDGMHSVSSASEISERKSISHQNQSSGDALPGHTQSPGEDGVGGSQMRALTMDRPKEKNHDLPVISDNRVEEERPPKQRGPVVAESSEEFPHAQEFLLVALNDVAGEGSIKRESLPADIQISVQSSPEARSVAEEEGSTIVEEFTIAEESYYEEEEIPESAPASPVNRGCKLYEDSFAFSSGLELHSPEQAKDKVVLDFGAMEHSSLAKKQHLQVVKDLEILMSKAKAEKKIEKLIFIKKNRLRVLTDLGTLMKRPKAAKETENQVSLQNQRIRVLEDLEKLMEEKVNAHEETEKQKSAKERMLSDLIETSKTWNLLDDNPRESKVNLSTERVADLITHINSCDKANTPVRWDLLGDLVSTEWVESPEKSTLPIQETCDSLQETTLTQKHPNTIPRVPDLNMEDFPLLAEDAKPEETCGEVNAIADEEEAVVTFRRQYNLSEGDMTDIVAHLELCEETNTEVRWDLINQITYPDDNMSLLQETMARVLGDHPSVVTDFSDSATSGFSIYPELLDDSILSDLTFLTEAEVTEFGHMANKRASKVHPGLKRAGSLRRIEEFQQDDSKPDSLYAMAQQPVLRNSETGGCTSSRPSSLVSKLVQLAEAKNVPGLLLKQRVSSLWESKSSANNPSVRGPFYRSLSLKNLGALTISPEKEDKDISVTSGHEPSKFMSILSSVDFDQGIVESPTKKADAPVPVDHDDSDDEYFDQSIRTGFEEYSVDEEVEVLAEDEEPDMHTREKYFI